MQRTSMRAAAAVSGALLLAAAVGTVTAYADHAGGPGVDKLIQDCDSGASCKSAITEQHVVSAERKQASKLVANCTQDEGTQAVRWDDATTHKVNTGVEVAAEGGLIGTFKTSFKATLGYEWSNTKTFGETVTMKIRPNHVGWVEHTATIVEGTMKLELGYGDRVNEHFIWFVEPVGFTGPVSDDKGTLVLQSRPMTDTERSGFCTGNPPGTPAGSAALVTGDDVGASDGGIVVVDGQVDLDSATESTVISEVDAPPANNNPPTPEVVEGPQ